MKNELVTIFILEKNNLLRSWLITSLVIFPFPFIPTIIKHGWSLDAIMDRIPMAALYAIGFATFVVIAAIIQNYNSLVERRKLFKKPAFKALDFYTRIGGVGSMTDEMESFLLGKLGDYFFRLNLIEPESASNIVEIVPFMKVKAHDRIEEELIHKFGFRREWFLGKEFQLSEAQLNDESYLKTILQDLERILIKLNAIPEEIDDSDFK